MLGLFETLLKPDREENPERAEVAQAANLLQVGEFQILQLAYKAWFNEELPEALSDQIFHTYMVRSEVPHWARHYARAVIAQAERGELRDSDSRYHRYDSDYYTPIPLGAQRLVVAVFCLATVLVGGLVISSYAPPATSLLPPYFNSDELKPAKIAGPPIRGS